MGGSLRKICRTKVTKNRTFKNQFFQKYGELYFLKKYLRVRLIECDREKDFSSLEHSVSEYFKLGGVPLVLRLIDTRLNKSAIYTSQDFDPHYFQLDKEKNKGIMGLANGGDPDESK